MATQTTIRSSFYKNAINSKKENTIIFQQECPEFVSEIEKEKLNLVKINYLSDLYLRPLIDKNIEVLILGCSHYPLIYDFLRKKLDS
ncbi:MAG: glutamate racemase, partial [Myxococcota bacterium]|nr:glutamate racemase [Myxococcota bacterium]